MPKTDTIVWIKPEQISSESMSQAISSQNNTIAALPKPSSNANITDEQKQLQSNIIQSRSTWGIWEEVQAWRGTINRPTPLIVQRCQDHGLNSAAFFLSFLLSMVPTPQSSSNLNDNVGIYHIPYTLPKPPPSTSSTPGIVMKKGLKSDLEKHRGLAVINHDPIWEEHAKRLTK